MPLDKELQEVLDQAKAAIEQGSQMRTQIDEMLAWGAENGRLADLEKAINELRADQDSIAKDIGKKIALAQSRSFNPRGGYRGMFGSRDEARQFALYALAKVCGRSWAADTLRSEFPDVAKDFSSTDADALIPEQFTATLIDMLETYGVFEPNATRFPMSTDTAHYSKKTGRTQAVPMSESSSVTETKPTVIRLTLTARKWGAYTEIPREVTEDALIAIAELIAMDMVEAHAQALDEAGFIGDGTGTYNSITGVVNALGSAAIHTSAGSSWGALTLGDFETAASLPKRKAFVDAKWYSSHQYFWQVMVRLMLASGGVTAGEVEGRRRLLFMGYPVELAQVLPTATAASQIGALFGSLRQGAVFGDRRQLIVRQSEHFKFSEDTIAMLSTRRYDVRVHGGGDASNVEVLSAVQTAA